MTEDHSQSSPPGRGEGESGGDETTAKDRSQVPEPSPAAYESVVRPFTWRSSLLAALVIWALLMFVVSECAVARSRVDMQDAPPEENRAGHSEPKTTKPSLKEQE